MKCTPRETKTFNQLDYVEGLTFEKGKLYDVELENGKYKVYLNSLTSGTGYLWFTLDELTADFILL